MCVKKIKSAVLWGVLVGLLAVTYSMLFDTADNQAIPWWIWSIPLLFALLLYVIYKITKAIFGQKMEKPNEDLSDSDEENTTQPPTPAPDPHQKDDHGASHGSSGGHGDGHHGPSLLDRVVTFGFIALMLYAGYWFYQNLHSLEGRPSVKHPVQVMTAGSNPVPVGSRSPKLNLAQHEYCQVPNGEVSTLKPSMTWTVVTLPQGGPGYEFCMDTLPDGKTVFGECSASDDGEDWGICGRWSKRARVRTTDKPIKTWFEAHSPA